MLNKKSLINLFLLFNLAMSIKTNNFCFIKQKECKGYYKQHYQIKCELIKCHGTFKHECGSTNICSDSITECSEYIKINTFYNVLNTIRTFDPIIFTKNLNQTNKIKYFNKNIKVCKNKVPKFKANDFCVNGKNCIEKKKKIGNIFGLFNYLSQNHIAKKTECHCPNEKSFKCGKYCTIDSNTCNYYKLIVNKIHFKNIKHCGNHNITYFI
jgi:hypothetical protein